jgi:hypothetical protein
MKRTLLLTFVALLAASQGFAQIGGSIGVYTNVSANNCLLPYGATANYIVVHWNHTGVRAAQFAAPIPPCANFLFLSNSGATTWGVWLGNTNTGVSVGYAVCQPGGTNILVTDIFVLGQGEPTECCDWVVTEHPDFPQPTPIATSCEPGDPEYPAAGRTSKHTNSTDTIPQCGCTIPTATSTWGEIKALFYSDS